MRILSSMSGCCPCQWIQGSKLKLYFATTTQAPNTVPSVDHTEDLEESKPVLFI